MRDIKRSNLKSSGVNVAWLWLRSQWAYYLTMGATTLVALLTLLFGSAEGMRWPAALSAVTLAGFLLARQVLMPMINRARDAEVASDAGAGNRFQRLHRLSVGINGVQWLAILAALWMVLL